MELSLPQVVESKFESSLVPFSLVSSSMLTMEHTFVNCMCRMYSFSQILFTDAELLQFMKNYNSVKIPWLVLLISHLLSVAFSGAFIYAGVHDSVDGTNGKCSQPRAEIHILALSYENFVLTSEASPSWLGLETL